LKPIAFVLESDQIYLQNLMKLYFFYQTILRLSSNHLIKMLNKLNTLNLLFIISISIRSSQCYYCDHAVCDSSSYCCGDQVCCLYLNDHWTYYFSLSTVAIILTAFIWIVYHFMYRKKKTIYKASDEVGFLKSKDNYA